MLYQRREIKPLAKVGHNFHINELLFIVLIPKDNLNMSLRPYSSGKGDIDEQEISDSSLFKNKIL